MKRTLFYNGKIVPMTERGLSFKAMGIEDGRIVYLGNDLPGEGFEPGAEKPYAYDEFVDLKGRSIYPGLCDSHVHLLYSIVLAGSSFFICNFEKDGIEPHNMKGVEKSIRDYAKNNPDDKLIVVNQYICAAIAEDRLPYASELDEWTGGRDVVVFTIDGHSCALSGSLAAKLKLGSEVGLVRGAEYDMNQGKITGCIASKANLSVIAKGVANLQNVCAKYGITKICALDGEDNGTGKDTLLFLLVLLASHMDIDVRLFPQYMDYSVLNRYGRKMLNKRIGGCSKWELDGSVSSRSAAFYIPFNGADSANETYYPDETVEAKITEGLSAGYNMTAHAIGTKAIDQIVSVYEKHKDMIPAKGPMPRIDHFEFPSESAVDFVKKNRIAITIQPGFAFIDKYYMHSYVQYLPEELRKLSLPLKDLMDADACVLGSTDSPVQSLNPYDQMRGMMDYYIPEQSIDAYDALKTYSFNASRALAEDDGCLTVGGRANFFITSYDIINLSKDEIAAVTADETYIDGRKLQMKHGTEKELIKTFFVHPKKI